MADIDTNFRATQGQIQYSDNDFGSAIEIGAAGGVGTLINIGSTVGKDNESRFIIDRNMGIMSVETQYGSAILAPEYLTLNFDNKFLTIGHQGISGDNESMANIMRDIKAGLGL